MRTFNTTGPVRPDEHYCLPPLARFNLDEVQFLIEQKKYFVLHAPRQVGKTSALLALMAHLNTQGTYQCLYFNVESAQAAREDVSEAMRAILVEIASRAQDFLNDPYPAQVMEDVLQRAGHNALNILCTEWARQSPKPLVLLIDEIDTLIGDTLISVLRQLRAGYDKRPGAFPQSVVLCGVRDVRDYRIHSDTTKSLITGGSAFNIKAESLRLENFTQTEVEALYQQHTTATGQLFTPEALELAWQLTLGQPWLVNALAYETCFKMKAGWERTHPIPAAMILQAKENLIQRRVTHLDQLVDKLKEARVQRVIGPMLEGTQLAPDIPEDDVHYVLDLGLIHRTKQGLEIANPIYREVIPRELTYITQFTFENQYQPAWYIGTDERLQVDKLLTAFQEFFRANSEHWLERFGYKEAGPQLLLQAFLQRIVNGDGRIEREYGFGRGRTDLLILWPYGKTGAVQKVVLELKIRRGLLEPVQEKGLAQTWFYLDRSQADEGHLLIFDRDPGRSWEEKIFKKREMHNGVVITVWGL
jgi:AAA-like domain